MLRLEQIEEETMKERKVFIVNVLTREPNFHIIHARNGVITWWCHKNSQLKNSKNLSNYSRPSSNGDSKFYFTATNQKSR